MEEEEKRRERGRWKKRALERDGWRERGTDGERGGLREDEIERERERERRWWKRTE